MSIKHLKPHSKQKVKFNIIKDKIRKFFEKKNNIQEVPLPLPQGTLYYFDYVYDDKRNGDDGQKTEKTPSSIENYLKAKRK